MHPIQILAYTPATVYGHPVPEKAGETIALVFIALIVFLIGTAIFKSRPAT